MRFSLSEAALELHSVVSLERKRVDFLEDQAQRLVSRGHLEPSPEVAYAGLYRRLERLQQLTIFIGRLAAHEAAVRALGPELAIDAPAQPDEAFTSH